MHRQVRPGKTPGISAKKTTDKDKADKKTGKRSHKKYKKADTLTGTCLR